VLLLREGEHLLETFLAAKARLLEAAEWRAEKMLADFIDPYVANIYRHVRAVRLVKIVSPDRGREAIVDRIDRFEHRHFVVPLEDAKHRSEDFFACYPVFLCHREDCRFDIESVLEHRVRRRSAAGDQPGTFAFG